MPKQTVEPDEVTLQPKEMGFLSKNRAANIYARHASYQQCQGASSVAGPPPNPQHKGLPGKCLKRGSDVLDADEGDFRDGNTRSPKVGRRMSPENCPGKPMGIDASVITGGPHGEQNEVGQHHRAAADERIENGEYYSVEERLAALEDKVKSLDNIAEKHVDDIDHVLSWMAELMNTDYKTSKSVEQLENELETSKTILRKTAELLLGTRRELKMAGISTIQQMKMKEGRNKTLNEGRATLVKDLEKRSEAKGKVRETSSDLVTTIQIMLGWITGSNR
ncbi:hypothetical protein FZEAL_3026 [Fusarium zealandicum]|uniref:Uncharacterized protein n=1 Tax=Fusarium zealandicum TaxID=1053134 RepID=A0A8H4XNB2_9HYPO|nr:hypothetical protein FZEAL_3026 [Fusarium zealandicum]